MSKLLSGLLVRDQDLNLGKSDSKIPSQTGYHFCTQVRND